jgi:hypothetical protein
MLSCGTNNPSDKNDLEFNNEERRLHCTVAPRIEWMSEPWTYWISVDIDTTSGKVNEVWIADEIKFHSDG